MRLLTLLVTLLFSIAARAEGLKESVLAQANALAQANKPYGLSSPGLVCNQFVSSVLRNAKAADFSKHDLPIHELISYLQNSADWSWTARPADEKALDLISRLQPGDIVFMARDKKKVACDTKVVIPQILIGGRENHVAVVVAVKAGAVDFAESGNKVRDCLKAVSGRTGGGTRIEEYSYQFVANTLYGFARPKS